MRRAAAVLGVAATLVACGSSSVRGRQLDIVLHTQAGSGTQTTAPLHFPDAKYTFFAWEDQTSCVTGMQFLDSAGRPVASRAASLAGTTPGDLGPMLVQKRLSGDYRMRVTTATATCSWMVEEILNSMQSDDPAPAPEPAPRAPTLGTLMTTGSAPITITAAGLYEVTLEIDNPGSGHCDHPDMGLRTAAGELERLEPQPLPGQPGVPPSGGMRSTLTLFLAPGVRTVTGAPSCPWQVSVQPLIGGNGGGVRGFAPPA